MPNPDKGLAGDCIKLWKHQQLATVDESQKWHIRKVYGTRRSRQQVQVEQFLNNRLRIIKRILLNGLARSSR